MPGDPAERRDDPLDSARWRRIQELFHAAAELAESERRAFLEAASGGDAGLVTSVLEMLEEDSRTAPWIDRGVAPVASRVLGEEARLEPPPRQLGPYRIRGLLGEGGMGVVYLAEREDLGNRVAIKILRDAWLSPARRERFATEQRTLAQLDHPLIARLYDADILPDGTPWFAMEYVDGVPLTDYCRTHATSVPGRLKLFRSVCEAVLHAHGHAVIHRDLKPSNILVKHDGAVWLLDFGIAKHLESLDAQADQTRTGLRLMTPAYAAPEQLRGDRVGIHSDVYSLGVILYELLTGRVPSRAQLQAAPTVPEKDVEKPSVAARRLAASLPAGRPAPPSSRAAWADLDVLCLTAMHGDPVRRYRSVEALIRDVDHYLRGEPLEARPDSLRYRMSKFVGRHRSAVLAGTAAALVVVGLVGFYTAQLARARNAALAEAARTARIQRFTMRLFDGGDEEVGPAEDLRVAALVERGLREARALDAEPGVQSELYMTLGNIQEKLGKLDRAEALLESALEQRRALHGPEHADIAESLVALGLLRLGQGRPEEAERLVREGLEMSRRNLPAHHPAVARATTALGRVLAEQGDQAEAIRVLEEAARLQSAPGIPSSDLAATLTELANAHFYAGRYDVSDTLNRRVLDMDREVCGERNPRVAYDLINLGAIQQNLGRYQEAERFHAQALEIVRDWYGIQHPETASAMTLLARALLFQGRLAEADDLLRKALDIQEHVYGPVHPRVASALNELASVALEREDPDAAEALYRRVERIYREVHGERHHLVALALANVASVDLKRKEYARAERLLRDVVFRFTEALSADDLNTGIARIKLGRALLGQGRHAEAEAELLAGYEIVARQADPSVSWLRAARRDLVAVYEALNQPERAERFRTEPAAAP